MPADLTAKKQSDLRVAAMRGFVASPTALAVGSVSGTASFHTQAEQVKARFSGLVDRLPGAIVVKG